MAVDIIKLLDEEWLGMAGSRIRKLKSDAEDAIKEIANSWHSALYDETINWLNLHCTEAGVVISDTYVGHRLVTGYTGFRIVVSEADPDSPKLHEAIREGLNKRGWFGMDIQIVTEY